MSAITVAKFKDVANGLQPGQFAVGERTTLNQLFELIQRMLRRRNPLLPEQKPVYLDFRPGDVRHSLANIDKARAKIGYNPKVKIEEGIGRFVEWFVAQRSGNE